jgi:hypothetical protein
MGFPLWGFIENGGASEEGFQRGKPRRGKWWQVFASLPFPFVSRLEEKNENKKGREIH